MSRDLKALSADLRRASYFFQGNDVELAKKFVNRGLKNYEIPEHIRSYLLRIETEPQHAAEIAMTASIMLS